MRHRALTLRLNTMHATAEEKNSWFWKIFVETIDEFPSYFIQSKSSASVKESSERDGAYKSIMLLMKL